MQGSARSTLQGESSKLDIIQTYCCCERTYSYCKREELWLQTEALMMVLRGRVAAARRPGQICCAVANCNKN